MAGVLIEFAYLNDKQTLISIDTAGKDRHLQYYCTDCGEELTLRHGMDKRKHFAHRPHTNCEVSRKGCGESIFHKYWKQYFSEQEFIWIPRNLIYEYEPTLAEMDTVYISRNGYKYTKSVYRIAYGEYLGEEIDIHSGDYGACSGHHGYGIEECQERREVELIPQYFEKVRIVDAVKEKEFTLKDGRKIRPDVLLTLESGETVALEIWYTNKKTEQYQWAYAELGIEAYEVQITRDGTGHYEMKYLYSKKKKHLTEGIYNKKMNASYLRADNFGKSIYRTVAKWERSNWFNKDTVPRYNFHLIRKNGRKLFFRTTYRTFKQVKKSYGHLYEIDPGNSLERRILKDDLKLFVIEKKIKRLLKKIKFQSKIIHILYSRNEIHIRPKRLFNSISPKVHKRTYDNSL